MSGGETMNSEQRVRYKELKSKYKYKLFQFYINKICVEISETPIEILKAKYTGYSKHKLELNKMFRLYETRSWITVQNSPFLAVE